MHDRINVFSRIGRMVEDIVAAQGKEPIQLELYRRLIEKTGPTATAAIDKHISAFNTWYEENVENIRTKNYEGISRTSYIAYNDKVYLPMRLIFDRASPEEKGIIHKHILSIRLSYNPQELGDIKELLNGPSTEKGVNFIDGMMKNIEQEMSKIANTVDNHEHPLSAVNTNKVCSVCETEKMTMECIEGTGWGCCDGCFEKHNNSKITEETEPLQAIELLAANGGFSRLLKGFSDNASKGGINPMELMGSLQSYSNKNDGPDMGSLMGGLLGGGLAGGAGGKKGGASVESVEDMF
jgi:hypothetical protein